MVFLVDIILLVIIVACVINGAKKGFVRTLLSFASRIASLLLAFFISDKYDGVIYDKFLKETVISGIEQRVSSSSADITQQVTEAIESLPEFVLGIIKALNIDFSDMLSSSVTDGDLPVFLEETVVGPLSVIVCRVIIFVIISILASFVFNIIINLICRIVRLPVLRTANGALGAVLGLLNGLVCIYILSYVCIIAAGLTNHAEFSEAVYSSRFLEIFTSMNNDFIGV